MKKHNRYELPKPIKMQYGFYNKFTGEMYCQFTGEIWDRVKASYGVYSKRMRKLMDAQSKIYEVERRLIVLKLTFY